jgi:hypothetical protein
MITLAVLRDRVSAGNNMLAKIAIIAITTSNSISVNGLATTFFMSPDLES